MTWLTEPPNEAGIKKIKDRLQITKTTRWQAIRQLWFCMFASEKQLSFWGIKTFQQLCLFSLSCYRWDLHRASQPVYLLLTIPLPAYLCCTASTLRAFLKYWWACGRSPTVMGVFPVSHLACKRRGLCYSHFTQRIFNGCQTRWKSLS